MLRSLLLTSVALALAPAAMGAGPAATITSHKTTMSYPVGTSRRTEAAGCRHAPPAVSSLSVLSIRIVDLDTGAVALVGVCIEGAGPFPFLIDSGSALSVVDAQLSRRFHLRQLAAPERAAGIGCSTTVVPRQMSSWSVGGLTLKPQVVLSTAVPNLDASEPLAGVIGSDVLSRFGSVRIDYRARTMSLGTTASASPTKNGVLQGPTSVPTPAQFLAGVRVDAALTVVSSQGGVGVEAPIRFNSAGTHLFIVDTGAEVSMVSPLLARIASPGCREAEGRSPGSVRVPREPEPGAQRPLGAGVGLARTSADCEATGLRANGKWLARLGRLVPLRRCRHRLSRRPDAARIGMSMEVRVKKGRPNNGPQLD